MPTLEEMHRLQRVVEKFRKHMGTGGTWGDTFPLRRKDGKNRRLLSRALPIRSEQNEVVRWRD